MKRYKIDYIDMKGQQQTIGLPYNKSFNDAYKYFLLKYEHEDILSFKVINEMAGMLSY